LGSETAVLRQDRYQTSLGLGLGLIFLLLARYVPNVAKEEYMRSV